MYWRRTKKNNNKYVSARNLIKIDSWLLACIKHIFGAEKNETAKCRHRFNFALISENKVTEGNRTSWEVNYQNKRIFQQFFIFLNDLFTEQFEHIINEDENRHRFRGWKQFRFWKIEKTFVLPFIIIIHSKQFDNADLVDFRFAPGNSCTVILTRFFEKNKLFRKKKLFLKNIFFLDRKNKMNHWSNQHFTAWQPALELLQRLRKHLQHFLKVTVSVQNET